MVDIRLQFYFLIEKSGVQWNNFSKKWGFGVVFVKKAIYTLFIQEFDPGWRFFLAGRGCPENLVIGRPKDWVGRLHRSRMEFQACQAKVSNLDRI